MPLLFARGYLYWQTETFQTHTVEGSIAIQQPLQTIGLSVSLKDTELLLAWHYQFVSFRVIIASKQNGRVRQFKLEVSK